MADDHLDAFNKGQQGLSGSTGYTSAQWAYHRAGAIQSETVRMQNAASANPATPRRGPQSAPLPLMKTYGSPNTSSPMTNAERANTPNAMAWPSATEYHEGSVTSLAASADGDRVISASADETLLVWDLEEKWRTQVLLGHRGRVTAVAISADGCRAISGGSDRMVMAWNLGGHPKPRLLGVHGDPDFPFGVEGLAMSADGLTAISCANDGKVMVWDFYEKRAPRILNGHNGSPGAAAISTDGSRALTASECEMILWNVGTGHPEFIRKAHKNGTNAVALSANGNWGVSGSYDDEIIVWDFRSDRKWATLPRRKAHVSSLAISRDQKRIAATFEDGTLIVWDLMNHSELYRSTGDAALTACVWVGSRIVAGDVTGKVHQLVLEQ